VRSCRRSFDPRTVQLGPKRSTLIIDAAAPQRTSAWLIASQNPADPQT
jgi:hypothetical protein